MTIPAHQTLAVVFAIMANIISFFVYLAPLPTFYQIIRKRTTGGFHAMPYLVALFSAMLWLYYGFLRTNELAVVVINSIGCIIESIYLAIFFAYGTREARKLTAKILLLLNVVIFSSIVLFTHFLIKKSEMQVQVLGWICAGFSICVFVAPLSIMAQVIRTRSVEFMPFTLSFVLSLSAVMWFVYGLLVKDKFIAYPNVLSFSLALVQMILYGIYMNAEKVITETDKEKELGSEHIINIVETKLPAILLDAKSDISDDDDDLKEKQKTEKTHD